jgi:hypothetical protein
MGTGWQNRGVSLPVHDKRDFDARRKRREREWIISPFA